MTGYIPHADEAAVQSDTSAPDDGRRIADNVPLDEAVIHNWMNSIITGAILALDAETPSDYDPDYRRLYLFLFNGISQITKLLHEQYKACASDGLAYLQVIDLLNAFQCHAEELMLSQPAEKAGEK